MLQVNVQPPPSAISDCDDDSFEDCLLPPEEEDHIDGDEEEEAQEKPPVPQITRDDIVIAVMGVTGAGKTTFISHFCPDAVVGHGLQSCTSTVTIHPATINSQPLFLVDTPGFDDTHRSDTDILRELADWLLAAHASQIRLTGIIYLHRITDNRMSGSAAKNLRMFRHLVGGDALPCVVLATTMWSYVTPAEGARRESELRSRRDFWAAMIAKGSRVLRHDDGENSARIIIEHILARNEKCASLKIQREMARGKTLEETGAGREVRAELAALRARYEAQLADLRSDMEEAARARDDEAQRELEAVRAELNAQIRRGQEEIERMRVDMHGLYAERVADLTRQRDLALERERDMRDSRDAWVRVPEPSSPGCIIL